MASEHARGSLNALPPGTVLRDYVIESELGSGGFGIVYLARHHLKSDWLYAVKEFLPAELAVRAREGAGVRPLNTEAESAFGDGLRRFRDEAEQLRKFRNERYIVSCLNYFEENGTAYLVMDYDDGLPLSELLRLREEAGQPFTEDDLLAVVEPLLEGLAVVHRAGVLHRDIKPGNIFVRRQDDITGRPAHPVLIDFGAAKQNYMARHSQSQAPHTPGYAAYEQVSSMGEIGPWTDIYALGALMWRMVAGGCPGDSRLLAPEELKLGTVWSPKPRPADRRVYALYSGQPDPMVPADELGRGRFSPHLLAAIDACLVLIPEDRVQSCEQLQCLLERPKAMDSEQIEDNPEQDSVGVSTSARQPLELRHAENKLRRDKRAAAWEKPLDAWRMVRRRFKGLEQRSRMSRSGLERQGHSKEPLANRRKNSIRFGVMFGLSAPILQFVLERLELAINLSPAETVLLALFTFLIAALFHLLLDNNVKLLDENKRWIASMLTLGVLQGITIWTNAYFGVNVYFALLFLPIFWIPSSIGLVLLLRLFDKPDYSITLRITLQAALLLMVAYLTWTAHMGVFSDWYDASSRNPRGWH